MPDLDRIIELLRDDSAMPRAINFTSSFVVLGNILGASRKRYISDWTAEQWREYPLQRGSAWDLEFPPETAKSNQEPIRFTPAGDEQHFRQLLQSSRHSQVKMFSLIREPLWNKAKWYGFGFVAVPGFTPILTLVFGEQTAAQRIFASWEEELGKIDHAEALRISIIRGISKRNPHHYRVLIGSNIEPANLKPYESFAMMSRINTMTPTSSENLESFLLAYKNCGAYNVAPAVADNNGKYPRSIGDFQILKRQLIVRNAWEIGRNDIDCIGIQPGDKPIIPAGITDPPIVELLKWAKQKEDEFKARQSAIDAEVGARESQKAKEKKKQEKNKKRQQKKSSRRNRQ